LKGISMNPLKALQIEGQSIWLDYIRRSLMTSGELNKLIEEDGLRGMTSNPTIFEKAINGSADYDESLRRLLEKDPHADIKNLYEALAIDDIQMATDILRPIYDESNGADGYVSLEVSPKLAADTNRTVEEARRLWKAVDRPNLMIKVPATAEGVPAFEQLIADGINVNCTLMFSLQHYENVAQAYIRGLERCAKPEKIASVASFFVSRVDSIVDKALEENGSAEARSLMGKAAVANAKLAYKRFQEIFYGEPFGELKARGCRVQRPLWASTSTKNPDYLDVLYVDELIGPDTVNTLPPNTLEAFRDHGVPRKTVTEGVDQAQAVVDDLAKLGIDFNALTEKLQVDGVAAFARSFEELLEALKKKRSSVLSSRSDRQYLDLGSLDSRVKDRLDEWESTEYAKRLWEKDPTLWSESPQPELSDRLGWLRLPAEMQDQVGLIEEFRREIHREDFDHAVLLGMGGSSLAPEVFQRTFGNRKGYPELLVLDSTHPDGVRNIQRAIDITRTLFIVSSKSGSTIETLSFFKYFWSLAKGASAEPGRQFVAITDAGSSLDTLAEERGFRRVFHAPSDVGGRYSALSVFGLVPAAVIGVGVHRLLDGAWAMMEAAGAGVAVGQNQALMLGAAIGEMAQIGRDKLTLVTSQSLSALPSWIEQLVAESTGKEGKGIVPIADEPIGPPAAYGNDRFFVYVSNAQDGHSHSDALDLLERKGQPVARIHIDGNWLLGQEFFRWEMAVAAAGSVLGIHPFNQPDVQLAKSLAKERMAEGAVGAPAQGWDDSTPRVLSDDPNFSGVVSDFMASAAAGDYIALQAYLAPDAVTTTGLQTLRTNLRDRTRLATTLGFGPRFLHSTGQLHKGGANNGLFIQIVDSPGEDLPTPETDYTFGALIRAQAMGDAAALTQRGRRVIRIVLQAGDIERLPQLIS
jgi:transaldolase/glucose-6-phosphate isomerase